MGKLQTPDQRQHWKAGHVAYARSRADWLAGLGGILDRDPCANRPMDLVIYQISYAPHQRLEHA